MKKFEINFGGDMFHPSIPNENVALQNSEVPNMSYDNVKIEDMRDNVLYDKSYSGNDKVAAAQHAQLSHMPKVQEIATKMQQLKDAQTGQGKKSFNI